jgi:hypothetical protein
LFCWRSSAAETWKPFAQRLPLTSTQCNLGGTRHWFLCPQRVGEGQPCGRRVALLYLRLHVFDCRKCCGLAYTSQSERRNRSRAVIQHAARPRTGDSPSVSAAILIEPGRGFGNAAGRGVLEAKLGQPLGCTALIERLSAGSLPPKPGSRRTAIPPQGFDLAIAVPSHSISRQLRKQLPMLRASRAISRY